MKNLLRFFVFIILFAPSIKAQWLSHHSMPNATWAGRAEFVDENTCWGVMGFNSGAEGFFRTSDGGNSWNFDSLSTPIYAIHPRSATTAYIGTIISGLGRIIKTIDGGNNWQIQTSAFGIPVSFMDYLYFFDNNNGLAMADPATGNYFEIYTTTNAGENWTKVPVSNIPPLLTSEYPSNIAFSIVNNTMFVPVKIYQGNKFRIYKSTNRGLTWTVSNQFTTTLVSGDPMSISFQDTLNGILIFSTFFSSGFTTSNYQIFKTRDGGNTWTEIDFSQPIDPAFICNIPGTSSGYFVSAPINNTGTAYTLDGGSNWTQVDNKAIWDVDFLSPSVGWAFSSFTSGQAIVYKWSGSPVTVEFGEVENRILDEFALEQNYPNPFNPTTTIGYVLKEKTDAKLILLNAIGEEVTVLVNEEQDKGFHKVDFNASTLASGVYFYRLQAGDFVQTRKMILLK